MSETIVLSFSFRLIYLVLVFQAVAVAQQWTPEVFASVGMGHLFRFEDLPIDDGFNFGAGIGAIHRSGLGGQIELNRTFGLATTRAPCAILDLPCSGTARQGVTAATIVSGNVSYQLGRARVRPYVTGGLGTLISKGRNSVILVSEGRAVQREEDWSDTGLAINIGAGLRVQLTESLSLRPEVRVYNATALSRANLSLLRPSLTLAWSW